MAVTAGHSLAKDPGVIKTDGIGAGNIRDNSAS